MISAVICTSLCRCWHLCNLPVFMHYLVHFYCKICLQVFAFEGQNVKLTVNLLLTCILYCLWCQKLLRLELNFASTVSRCLSQISYYLVSHVFLRRHCSFTSIKLYACLEKFLCFLQLYDQANVYGAWCITFDTTWNEAAIYVQVCWLCHCLAYSWSYFRQDHAFDLPCASQQQQQQQSLSVLTFILALNKKSYKIEWNY